MRFHDVPPVSPSTLTPFPLNCLPFLHVFGKEAMWEISHVSLKHILEPSLLV